MHDDDRTGRREEGILEYFAWINDGLIDGARTDGKANQFILCIEVENEHFFNVAVLKRFHEGNNVTGTTELILWIGEIGFLNPFGFQPVCKFY